VTILSEQIFTEPLGCGQVAREDFDLQRKIEQVVLQTVLAKAHGGILGLGEHGSPASFAAQADLSLSPISVCGNPTSAALLRLSRIWL